jgi:hypothetical protein
MARSSHRKRAEPVGDAERVVWSHPAPDELRRWNDFTQPSLFDYDPTENGPEQPEGER